MKKPYNYTEMSDFLCSNPGCKRHIKKNVAERKNLTSRDKFFCYDCHNLFVLQLRRDNSPK